MFLPEVDFLLRSGAMQRRLALLLGPIFALTGFSALLLQVVWQRVISLHSGVDLSSFVTVVAAFLAGLGVGSLVGGWLADRLGATRSLVAFSLANVGIGLYAWVSVFFFYDVYRELVSGLQSQASTFLFNIVVLIVPTVLMGLSLPLVARAVTSRVEDAGPLIGRMYGINTIGAAAGAAVGGWVLLGTFGFVAVTRIAGTLNLVAAALIALVWRSLSRVEARAATATADGAAPVTAEAEAASVSEIAPEVGAGVEVEPVGAPARSWPWFVIYGITGAVALAFEQLFFRLIDAEMRSNSYSFAPRADALPRAVRRRRDHRVAARASGRRSAPLVPVDAVRRRRDRAPRAHRPRAGAARHRLRGRARRVLRRRGLQRRFRRRADPQGLGEDRRRVPRGADRHHGAARAVDGRVVPVRAGDHRERRRHARPPHRRAALHQHVRQRGRHAAVGLRVHRRVRTRRAPTGCSPSSSRSSGSGRCCSPRCGARRCCTAASPSPSSAAVLVASPSNQRLWSFLHGVPDSQMVVAEDHSCATTLKYAEDGGAYLHINGSGQNGHPFDDFHLLIGTLPAVVQPDPQHALAIGFGAGSTTFAMLQDPRLDDVTTVELCGGAYDLADHLADEGRQDFERMRADPRYEAKVGDGRKHLLVTDERYDIVTVDTLRPTSAFSGSLYSKEFYELIDSRLHDAGMVAQWIPTIRTLNTISSVFPHVSLFRVDSYNEGALFVLASRSPIDLDGPRMLERFRLTPKESYGDEQRARLEQFLRDAPRFCVRNGERLVGAPAADKNFDLRPRDEYFLNNADAHRSRDGVLSGRRSPGRRNAAVHIPRRRPERRAARVRDTRVTMFAPHPAP